MGHEPKKKHSKARKRTRRAAIILTTSSVIKCPSCGQLALPHQVCGSCGFYAGKKVSNKVKVHIAKA